MDVFGRNIERGCRTVVDLGGYSYVLQPDGPVRLPRTTDPAWQQVAGDYLTSGRAVVLVVYRQQLTPAVLARIKSGRMLVHGRGLAIHDRPRH